MNRLIIFLFLLCTGSAYGMDLPCHVIGENGKPTGDVIIITPYKKQAGISIGANHIIFVPYYGNADGAGVEYQNNRWDIIIGKSSPTRLSFVVLDSKKKFGCGGYIDIK